MLAIGNNELGEELKSTILCPRCGEEHKIESGTDTDGNPSGLLQFYSCGESAYLAGIGGRSFKQPQREEKPSD